MVALSEADAPYSKNGGFPMSFTNDEIIVLYPNLMKFARSLCRNNRADAYDLVQDTIIRAFRNRSGFTAGTDLRKWLFKILHRIAKDDWRAERVRRKHAEEVRRTTYLNLFQDPPQFHTVLLAQGLSLVSPLHRQHLMLADVLEFGYEEAARECGVPVGTFQSRLNSARTSLRAVLA